MITNADITLYNKYYDEEDKCNKYKRSYLRGVNYRSSYGTTTSSKSINNNDENIIYIPFSVYSEDKEYIKPNAYEKLSKSEKEHYFTFNSGDIVVKGIIDFELTNEKGNNLKSLNEFYDDVSTVNNVKTYDCGSDHMKHWKVVCS